MATSAPHAHGPQKGGALSGLSGGTADATLSAERISPDFLVVVLDLNPEAWQKNRPGTSGADATFTQLEQVLNAVLVFLNAQTAMQHGNGLAVYGAVAGTAQLLYTTAPFVPHRKQPLKESSLSMSFPFKHIDDAVFSGVRDMMREACTAESLDHPKTVGIVRALALALCHINRLTALSKLGEGQSELDTSDAGHKRQRNQAASTAFRYRILVLSATPDTSSQYVPMMNCIFSAQKQVRHPLLMPEHPHRCVPPVRRRHGLPAPGMPFDRRALLPTGRPRRASSGAHDCIPAFSLDSAVAHVPGHGRCGFPRSLFLPPPQRGHRVCVLRVFEHLLCAAERLYDLPFRVSVRQFPAV